VILFCPLPGNEAAATALAQRTGGRVGQVTVRAFPDGESYARFDTPVLGEQVALVCTLHRPDEKILPLLFLAEAARELGAAGIGLVAPYLAYMRQDCRFRDGEAVSSLSFARLLSGRLDWMATVDPHLHRNPTLEGLYPIPTRTLHAAPRIAEWIRGNVPDAVLVGPDAESAQWVGAVASLASVPSLILEKTRRGDLDVEVSVPRIGRWRDRTPVLVDDIISTARTQAAATRHLRSAGLRPPVCIGVHAVFAADAYQALMASGAGRIVTCNTIPHPSNAIDILPLVGDSVRDLVQGSRHEASRRQAAVLRPVPSSPDAGCPGPGPGR